MDNGGMKFEELPGEVISDNIFPWLALNDLLRLRRVSKLWKSQADDYLRIYGSTKIFIDTKEYFPTHFVVPVTRATIYSPRSCSWDQSSETVQVFVRKYGSKITHLRVNILQIPMVASDIEFFESFSNLEHLSIEHLYERGILNPVKDINEHRAENKVEPFLVPCAFKRLKTLSIPCYTNFSEDMESVRLVWKFLYECGTRLESFQHPNIAVNHNQNQDWGDPLGHGPFGCIRSLVEKRPTLGNSNNSNLKSYDLEGYFGVPLVRDFYELVTTCAQNDVKLYNVKPSYIEEMMTYESGDMENHGKKISAVVASLQSLSPLTFLLGLPKLEKIDIMIPGSSPRHEVCRMPEVEFERHAWPELREIVLLLFPAYVDDPGRIPILYFLFAGIKRENMTTLTLNFKGGPLVQPLLPDVCVSCPNLKKLYLGNWWCCFGDGVDISQLWSDLPLLEEVEFTGCGNFGNEAFIGPDSSDPSMFRAKNLKRLAFLILDDGCVITDSLFTDVLRHMPLKELELGSRQPVQSFTLDGLASLLKGVFADTIEKFSITEKLQLQNAKIEELSLLESKFRSANMF